MKSFFILFVAVFLAVSAVAYAANLLPNSSFEELKGAIGDDPMGWWSWHPDYNGITTDVKRTGEQAIYFTSYPGPEEHGGVVYSYENVKPGKDYTFSCYVINSVEDPINGGAFGQLSIEWRKGDEEITRTWGPVFGEELSSSKWELMTMSGIAPQEADICNFVIQFFNKDGGGTFYADDATAEEK